MVAVVSGSGLGLFNTRGANGDARVGRDRDQVLVNGTTGTWWSKRWCFGVRAEGAVHPEVFADALGNGEPTT